MNDNVKELLLAQVTQELHAAHTYLQIAFHLEARSYSGTARWFFNQASEEHEHARAIAKHLVDRGISVTLTDVVAPEADALTLSGRFDVNIVELAFQVAAELEMVNTKAITDIHQIAINRHDMEAVAFIQPFVAVQTGELAEIEGKLNVLGRIKDDVGAMYAFDVNLAE